MLSQEPNQILYEFDSLQSKAIKPPKGKSNRAFIGHVFAGIALRHMENYISKRYKVVFGPLWMQQLEWIQWDGAIVKRDAQEILEKYYHPNDVVALFEFKTRGIYGRKEKKDKQKTVHEVIEGIRQNFRSAQALCPNLKRCFYVTLHERKPMRRGSIDYFGETKKLEPEIVTCILFDAYSIERRQQPVQYPNEWNRLINELQRL